MGVRKRADGEFESWYPFDKDKELGEYRWKWNEFIPDNKFKKWTKLTASNFMRSVWH